MNKIYKKINLLLITAMLLSPISTFALTKVETIYSNLNANGDIKNTSVNVQLKNIDKGDIIDYTNLDSIKNLNGVEKFSKDSEKITWKSTGKDIFYQGKIEKNLPLQVSVKYYLDNVETDIAKLKNKKGNIRIEYHFKNNSYDPKTGLYTPFVVTSVFQIPAKNNRNVSVVNGKVVSTGNKNIVTAIAAPGLYDSIKSDLVKDMDTITVTYETESFSLGDVYFMITPKVLEEIDINRINNVGSINNSLNTLQNGMDKLEEGSMSLADGSDRINDGAESLNIGIKKALAGSKELTTGLTTLKEGTNSFVSLNTMIDTLYSTYRENEQLLEMIVSGIAKAKYEEGIKEGYATKSSLEANLSMINANITALEQIPELSDEQTIQLETLRGKKVELEEYLKQCSEKIAEAETNLSLLPENAAKITGANEVIEKVLLSLLGVDGKEKIDEEHINAFKTKIMALLGGVEALENGSKELTNGLEQIDTGSNSLLDGTNKIKDGSKELSNGIKKINDEGINKLTNYGREINNYSNILKELINLAKNYKGFSSDNIDSTIFIYKLSAK